MSYFVLALLQLLELIFILAFAGILALVFKIKDNYNKKKGIEATPRYETEEDRKNAEIRALRREIQDLKWELRRNRHDF